MEGSRERWKPRRVPGLLWACGRASVSLLSTHTPALRPECLKKQAGIPWELMAFADQTPTLESPDGGVA